MNQLKVRTEFSFKQSFAPVDSVVERLKAIGATAAGCVDLDGSTWGHVAWEKACKAAGITPMFGVEVVVAPDLGKITQEATAWALSTNAPALYQTASLAQRQTLPSGKPALTKDQFLAAEGLVKFTGTALASDPEAVEAGCWIDINPGSVIQNLAAIALHRRTGGRLVMTSDNNFSRPEDRRVYELIGNTAKTTPQHILTRGEMIGVFGPRMTNDEIEAALAAVDEAVAAVGAVKLLKAPIIKVTGDVEALCRDGIRRRLASGQIAAWTEEYEARLQRELALVREKEFDSYFLVVADMVAWAKERMLVGPGRGSAAGSLMCYVMYITEVDPIPYGLMFERFVDVTRKDLPDIDLDFPDTKRDQVYEYLAEKYGRAMVARIGTVSEYKPKSAIAEVAKRLGIPPWETQAVKDAMIERSSGDSRASDCLADTFTETAPGRELAERFPAIVLSGEIEGHASHSGVHAAGVIVCNEPVENFCCVKDGVAQLDKKDAEALGLLKIDALGLRTLSVIEGAGTVSSEEIYALTLDDPAAFAVINAHKFTGVFQWEGPALQSLTTQVRVNNFNDMAQITALARPGPLGGGAASKFADRRSGREPVTVAHPSMMPYLEESYGLVLYQEQVMRIVREIGQFTWEETSTIRKAMSGRMGKEFFDKMGQHFVEGAAQVGLKPREALDIWEQINSMGAWAFNKSHSVSYAIVSYWTAWLKAHHPLAYAASALRNAKDEETAFSMLREIVAEGVKYIPFDPELSELNWSVKDGVLIGGFLGLKGIGPSKAAEMLASRAAGGLTEKQRAMLAKTECVFADLWPTLSRWRDYYENPEAVGLRRGSRAINIIDFPEEGGEVVFIGLLKRKDARDKNEEALLAKRGGKRHKGPSAFVDVRLADDTSLGPMLCRIDPYDYEPVGRLILERGREDHHWFLVRGKKLRNIPMVSVEKIKCLNEPDLTKENRDGQ